MDANNFAGSDFLKAADLGQSTPQITIAKVESVDFDQGDKSKLVIHPTDPACKPIVLNVTNTRACIAAWGAETQSWLGKVAMLSVRQTQMGPGIGVTPMMLPQGQTMAQGAVAGQATAPPHGQQPGGHQWPGTQPVQQDAAGNVGAPFDDDIPFG